MQTLNVYSIFKSIDGECNSAGQGALTIFLRLAGCNLFCQYPCDTQYSFKVDDSMKMPVIDILCKIRSMGIKKVTITGGEPLLQADGLVTLLAILKNEGYTISVETNGSLSWGSLLASGVDSIVADYKLPSSGEEGKMLGEGHFLSLRKSDFIKFVIMDKTDFVSATHIYYRLRYLGALASFAFSPVYGVLEPVSLLKMMMENGIENAILNVQLHKILQLKEDW